MKRYRVFGIGLNKTGTTSLKLAFQKLGLRHFDRRPRAFKLYRQKKWDQLFEMIDGFDSFEDWPWPLMVPQLLDRFGDDARFVFTRRRSANAWVESLKAHALKTHPVNNPRRHIFGYGYPHGAEEAHMAFYERHKSEIAELFEGREYQFLDVCWEEGDGWAQLCGFLGVPEPRQPFPHANRGSSAEIDPERLAENELRIARQIAHLKKS